MKDSYKNFPENPESKRRVERFKIDRDNIKIYLKEIRLEKKESWVLANKVLRLPGM
jgi:hypothetical protein